MDIDKERRKLDAGQRKLNFAWGFGGVGMASTLIAMTTGIPIQLIGPWLALCGGGAIVSLILSIVAYTTTE